MTLLVFGYTTMVLDMVMVMVMECLRGALPGADHDDGVQVDDVTADGVLVDTYTFAAFNVLRVVFNVRLCSRLSCSTPPLSQPHQRRYPACVPPPANAVH